MVNDESLKKSFASVKEDIMKLKAQMIEISGQQAEIFNMIQDLRRKATSKRKKR